MNIKQEKQSNNSFQENEKLLELNIKLKTIQKLASEMQQIAARELEKTGKSLNKMVGNENSTQSSFEDRVKFYEIELIVRALIKSGGRQIIASKLLGIKKTTLNAKIKRYQIPVGKFGTFKLETIISPD